MSTDHGGEPLVCSNSQVAEAVRAPALPVLPNLSRKNLKPRILHLKFQLYMLALHWADQTKQM